MKHVLSCGLAALATLGLAASADAQSGRAPSTALRYNTAVENPGDGYLTGGDLWNTLKPSNTSEPGRLGSPFANVGGGTVNRMLFGSRGNWQEPGGQWPSGYNYSNTFRNSHFILFPLFKATGWPGYLAGNPLRTPDTSTDTKGAGGTSRFMWASYSPNLRAAADATRNYKRPARYTDASRTHLVYEAGWPTTSGIDFKVRAHQFTPNEQNLNDFTVLEITLTNTGEVDSNADGTFEATNNVVDGVSMMLDATPAPAIEISRAGDRGCNCIQAGRTFGYIAAKDPATNTPYDLFAWYANVPPTATTNRATPAAGARSFGIDNRNFLLGYSDIWNAWSFLGVKQGSIDATNLGAIRPTTPDKQTAFGTHPVGTGERRGWFGSAQWQSSLHSLTASDLGFRSSTAAWYRDYGKTSATVGAANLSPNPAFFSGGTADDISTFTVGNANARPNGDFKYASEDVSKFAGIEQPIWEAAWNAGAANGQFYTGGVGFTKEYTFGQAVTQGNGPYRLAVGESITFVWTALAGFRMEGVVDASRAARWAWERGWQPAADLPVPAAPDMNVESTEAGTALVRWTDVAGIRPITGYKIWRSSQFKRQRYLDKGMRLVDRYHEQHVANDTAAVRGLLDPVNPNFDARALFKGDIQGTYQPAEWGTYDLVAKIPTGSLSQYANAAGGYNFAYEDTDAITGFTYWYYVSAYRDGSFTGPLGRTATHVESASLNRNGRNGRSTTPGGSTATPNATISLDSPWAGTYPFATSNAVYPKVGTQAFKNIGAAFTVTPPVVSMERFNELITVTPNPYKITGLNDVRNDPASHTISFLNTPANFRITILDVSGQVILRQDVRNATNGRFSWDLFSKDGIEVASGVYVYHIAFEESDGAGGFDTRREATGHFAILR